MVTPDSERQEREVERYSFSKLSSWWTCPYGFFLKYIERKSGIGNAFASYGTLVHEIMEKYAKGEVALWDLPQMYEWLFDSAITEQFPPNKFVDLRESYYNQGINFLKSFAGYEQYKIFGVEEKFELSVDDWKFIGVIDLVFEDENGKLIIRDYKSKASFKNKEEQSKYARQLYLYALYVKEKYGRYPDELQFLMFRKQKEPIRIPFNETELQESIDWAKDTVRIIRNAFDYPPQCEDFYSQHLCNHREYCPHRIKPKYKYKKR